MGVADTQPPGAAGSLERQRWDDERAFRAREVAVKEREQQTREAELALAERAQAGSRWKSPLVVAIFAAAVAALGNALVVYTNGRSQTNLEAKKAEEARILEMIKTGSPDRAAENLKFLLNAGLINDSRVRGKLTHFLAERKPGTGPALPSTSAAANFASKFEGSVLKPHKDVLGRTVIGSDHVLSPVELRSGKLVIGGKSVDFRSGITQEQANRLLAEDLKPSRKAVQSLVTVPLSQNQLDALTDFVYNMGVGPLEDSPLLKKLNAGRYDEVPKELLKYDRVGGTVLPGLLARRRSEARLWNK